MLYIFFLDNDEESNEMGLQANPLSHRRYYITLPMPATLSLH